MSNGTTTTDLERPEILEEHLLSLGMPEPNSGCLIWMGRRDQDGYGRIRFHRKEIRLGRLVLELSTGERLPAEMQACHRCDLPPCFEPRHLFPGTLQQNRADMVRKRRQSRGERHHSAKLNDGEVEALRMFSANGVPGITLADVFSVSRSQVSRIVNRKERV